MNKVLLYLAGGIGVIAMIMWLIEPIAFYTLLAVAVLALVVYACMNWSWARWTTGVVLYLALIGTSIYSGVMINNYYSVEGGIFGKISGIFDTNQVAIVDEMSFDFTHLTMTATTVEDEYMAQMTINETMSLENDKNYAVFVNNTPCGVYEVNDSYVLANYNYIFYGYDMQVILEDTLEFRFTFNKNNTDFVIRTKGGSEAVDLWNTYFARNNFTVEIKETDFLPGDVEIGDGDVTYVTANYYVNNEVYLSQVYHPGESVDFPNPTDIKNFVGWTTDKENLISSYTINANTNFYAKISENINVYVVNYVFNGQVIHTERVNEGSKLTPYTPTIQGYTFQYWDIEGSKLDYENYIVTKNVNISAHCQANNNILNILFSTSNNIEDAVEAGRISVDTQSADVNANNNNSNSVRAIVKSGADFNLTANLGYFFRFATDSAGNIRCYVLDEATGSTNKLILTEPEERTFETVGFTQRSEINFEDINSGCTIIILLEPIYFNLELNFGNIKDYETITIKNLVHGREYDLKNLLNSDQISKIQTSERFNGFNDYEMNGGDMLIDADLKTIGAFTYDGFRWNGGKYQKVGIDTETNTIALYVNRTNIN